jgi:formate hydrogenlyase subunit 3/multisubunit Na+/H+ antiporter MnhD subunit
LPYDDELKKMTTARADILNLVDSFIDQMSKIRTVLKGVSVSALILAPLAIGLSLFLVSHPSFFAVIDRESEFGLILVILLALVIVISSIWVIIGIRQYRMVTSWNERYSNYVSNKEEIDRKIALDLGLQDDSEDAQ